MTENDPPLPLVRRHHWIVRVTHWGTAVVLAGMIASGLQIYEAYSRFGGRGGPFPPSPLGPAPVPPLGPPGGGGARAPPSALPVGVAPPPGPNRGTAPRGS